MQIQDDKKKVKNIQYEYIRTFAIIAVIAIHTFNSALLQFGDSTIFVYEISYKIIMNLMWWAVPCFLMLSGSLLLDTNKTIDLKKLYRKYILRMISVLFTFGFVYAWLELFFKSRSLRVREIILAFGHVITGDTWAHMWYIYCLIGIYALLPMYKLIACYASNKELKYILLIMLIFEAIIRLTKIFDFNIGFYCHINTIYPFWFLMGNVKNRNLIKLQKKTLISVLFGSMVLLVLTTIYKEINGINLGALLGYNSILVIIQSIAVFELITNMKNFKGLINKILLEIANKSFGIYIIHMFFINVVYKLIKFNPFNTPVAIGAVILVIINLSLSYLVVNILKKIPILKKIM